MKAVTRAEDSRRRGSFVADDRRYRRHLDERLY